MPNKINDVNVYFYYSSVFRLPELLLMLAFGCHFVRRPAIFGNVLLAACTHQFRLTSKAKLIDVKICFALASLFKTLM
jgi:hypothetical protein